MDEKLDQLEETSETPSEIASTWNESHEMLLAAIGNRANCSAWMHDRCHARFESYNFYLTIPSIAISGIAGLTSLLSSNMIPPYYQELGSWIVGIATISCGVLQSVNQLIKSQQKAEEHRSAAVAYMKVFRTISGELALRRDQRLHAQAFLKVIRMEQDKLQESAPPIPESVREQFLKTYKNSAMHKPELVEFQSISINTDSGEEHDSRLLRQEESKKRMYIPPRYPSSPPNSPTSDLFTF
jgi:hypothetical protein